MCEGRGGLLEEVRGWRVYWVGGGRWEVEAVLFLMKYAVVR